MTKTLRRDVLLRKAKAGKLILVDSYHFDDMTGESRGNKEMPVAIRPEKFEGRKEGVAYLFEHDFKTKSGAAYLCANGTISLHVHSNCHFTLRYAA
jgi:hypothetical protein